MQMRMVSKRLAALFLAGMMVVSLMACGDKSVTADAVSVGTKLVEADTSLPEMEVVTSEDDGAELSFTALCDADYNLVDSYYYSYAKDGTAPEIAVVTAKKESDDSKIMEAIVSHVENRRGTMAEYSPDQVALVESYTLVRRGRVICYIVSEKRGLAESAFTELMDAASGEAK